MLEARIDLGLPGNGGEVCGVSSRTLLDLAASKLLANAGRWSGDGVFGCGVIDLAMMQPGTTLLKNAIVKAEQAYGAAIQRDLIKAIDHLRNKTGWLERCMTAMTMTDPKAVVWQRIKALKRCCTV